MTDRILGAAALLALFTGTAAAQAGGVAAPTPPAPTPTPATPAAAEGTESPLARLPIVQERLENGLRVVMSSDRTIPTVAIAIYYEWDPLESTCRHASLSIL